MVDYSQLLDQAGRQYNVDPALLRAQMQIESGGNPDALSEKGAQGLMQIIPATQKALGVTDPNDPKQSIFAAARLMAENLDRYGNVADAVKAYHGGTDQSNWGPKTRAYAQNVTGLYSGGMTVAAPRNTQAAPDPEDFAAMDFARPSATAAAPAAPEEDFAAMDFARPTAAAPVQQPAPAVASVAPGAPAAAPAQPFDFKNPLDYGRAFTQYATDNTLGALAGLRDVADAPTEWAAKGFEKSGLTGLLADAGINLKTEAQQIQANRDRRAGYDAQYGDNFAAGAGRLGGQALATMAPIGGAQAGLVRGGNALIGALRGAPVVGGAAPALGAVGKFAAGNGGLLSRATNLGVQGAAGGALMSGGSDTPIGDQMALGAALGAGIPVVGAALGRGAGAVADTAKAISRPFTAGGRQAAAESAASAEARSALGPGANGNPNLTGATMPGGPEKVPGSSWTPANAVDRAAYGGGAAGNFDTFVPGSQPTLAQATGNQGLFALENAAKSRAPNAFAERDAQNYTARQKYLEQASGTPENLAILEGQRDFQTLPLLQSAMAQRVPANAQPVMDKIESILASREGQKTSVVNALKDVKNKLDLGPAKGLQSDADQLYGLRGSINNQLETVAGRDNSASQQATRQLLEVRDTLDDVIAKAAPDYVNFVRQYAALSEPISAQRYLQNLQLTDQGGQRITLAKVNSAINGIERLQKAPGANDAKSITPDQLQTLKNIQADLIREAGPSGGRVRGSNTFQNLSSNALIDALSGGGGVAPGGLGAGLGYVMGGVPGMAMGGFAGQQAGNILGASVKAKAPEMEERLINLLLAPTGPQAIRTMTGAAPSSPALENALLQRGAVGGAESATTGSNTGKKGR